MAKQGWIGIDLDGTLAHYTGWDGGKIGPPIPRMQERVKKWLAEGKTIKIVTARVAMTGLSANEVAEQRLLIEEWCIEHLGQALAVTATKDFGMIRLYDDRCVQVEPNTGQLIGVEEED